MASIAMTFVGTDQWNAQVHGVMSQTYTVRYSVGDRLSSFFAHQRRIHGISRDLRNLNKNINDLLQKIYSVRDAPKPTEVPDDFRDRVQSAARQLRELSSAMRGLYSLAERKQLTNNSRVAAGFGSHKAMAEEVLEIAEWLEDYLNSDNLRGQFDRAHAEFERGETVDIYTLM